MAVIGLRIGDRMNNIFVGNLSFKATKEDVIKLFEPFGSVANAVIMERKKGKSRGYGFVDMPNEEQKNAAIAALEGKEFMWRVLSVSPVIPKVKSEVKLKRESKRWSKPSSAPKSESTSDARSKYYSKIDGPPKPWRKVNSNSKPDRNKDKGSRPYYGKSDRGPKADDRQPKSYQSKPLANGKGGFKMRHKVSGASKSAPKKGATKTLSDIKGSKE